MNNKILLNKDLLDKITSELKELKTICRDEKMAKKIEDLLNNIVDETTNKTVSLEELIREKMKETKLVNPDLNASLYLLYRNLVNGKITQEDALRRFEAYVRMEGYDKKIY
ncbi:hypothetical protein P8V03_00715 [Clostridium sp. A1-XYC3]|uniref:Uncharacterized protein n=1 Tax=Clostridium tanneri TaxID=3037988 RepID=A0ABU4JNJ7_9CLOT|nr:hypothetical protein [Clostridium sp. A1-XYC3]MDW8799672.1 hypothetical protein [Clostridium sp. A1-XYC3]